MTFSELAKWRTEHCTLQRGRQSAGRSTYAKKSSREGHRYFMAPRVTGSANAWLKKGF